MHACMHTHTHIYIYIHTQYICMCTYTQTRSDTQVTYLHTRTRWLPRWDLFSSWGWSLLATIRQEFHQPDGGFICKWLALVSKSLKWLIHGYPN